MGEYSFILDKHYFINLQINCSDRYKDVLAASDAIKSMKAISQEIVDGIDHITSNCEDLTHSIANIEKKTNFAIER